MAADDSSADSNDLLLAFDLAPVGLLVARRREVRSYNQAFCDIFGYAPEALKGQSLQALYPSQEEFAHIGERALAAMRATGVYADDRIMRRLSGEQFWCHVTGRTTNREDPFAAAVWVFQDLSATRPLTAELTTREREVAQFLVNGRTSKQIAADLAISFRTVEAHRARLMRKFGVSTSSELVARLVGRRD